MCPVDHFNDALMHTLLFTLLTFGILVTIHELGHYAVARWCGVKVLRFSLGIGKVLFSKKLGVDQTEWVISALPLGGYVKMLDIRESEVSNLSTQELKREFSTQAVWKRILIVAAGPIANFLLAIILFSSLYVYGVPDAIPKIRVPSAESLSYQWGLRQGDVFTSIDGKEISSWTDLRAQLLKLSYQRKDVGAIVLRSDDQQKREIIKISIPLSQLSTEQIEKDLFSTHGISLYRPATVINDVTPNGPADIAGLRKGDLILAVNGKTLLDSLEFSELVSSSADKALLLLIERDKKKIELYVTPRTQVIDGYQVARVQVSIVPSKEYQTVRFGISDALLKGCETTWDSSFFTLKMLVKMVQGEVSLKNISGPITISEYAGKAAATGLASYISFIALISISIGVMNLLPIPVLDGGHLLYYSLELLTGKPVSKRVTEVAQRLGIAILLSMMAIAFYNDIARQWHNAEFRQEQTHSGR